MKVFFQLWPWSSFIFTGLLRDHTERGASDMFPRGSSCLGEDAGEDESCWSQGIPNEEERGGLGQVHWSAVQLQQNEQVRQ